MEAWKKITSQSATANPPRTTPSGSQSRTVRLLTLDPGHFHAALAQKFMSTNVGPVVHVYSPGGPELEQHLEKTQAFNSCPEHPTHWKEEVYTGADFFQKMLQDKSGNVVIISGNNARKATYILGCVEAGLNVLADKPMAITPADFDLLERVWVAKTPSRREGMHSARLQSLPCEERSDHGLKDDLPAIGQLAADHPVDDWRLSEDRSSYRSWGEAASGSLPSVTMRLMPEKSGGNPRTFTKPRLSFSGG
jgi:hypothetical protein